MNRLVTTTRFVSFDELDPIFQDTYAEITSDNNDGVIDAAGTEIGSSPAAEVAEHLRSVCTSKHEAMQQFEKQQLQQEQEAEDAEAESSGGKSQPINNGDDFSDLTDQVYRSTFGCVRALCFTLDVPVLVDSFEDLPVLFQTSHGLLINEHGFINVSGTAPGVTLNDAQSTRLKTICSIMDAAVQDNKDMEQRTEVPTESPRTALPLVEKPVETAAAMDTEDETPVAKSPSAEESETNPPTHTYPPLSESTMTIDPPSIDEESAND